MEEFGKTVEMTAPDIINSNNGLIPDDALMYADNERVSVPETAISFKRDISFDESNASMRVQMVGR